MARPQSVSALSFRGIMNLQWDCDCERGRSNQSEDGMKRANQCDRNNAARAFMILRSILAAIVAIAVFHLPRQGGCADRRCRVGCRGACGSNIDCQQGELVPASSGLASPRFLRGLRVSARLCEDERLRHTDRLFLCCRLVWMPGRWVAVGGRRSILLERKTRCRRSDQEGSRITMRRDGAPKRIQR